MKKAVVLSSSFTDKLEGVIRNPGDVFECSDERADELAAGGWVSIEPAAEPPKPKRTTKKK